MDDTSNCKRQNYKASKNDMRKPNDIQYDDDF